VKLLGKIFGGFYALFGTVLSLLDVLDWVNMVRVFPQLPGVNELVYSHILVFFIGIFMAVCGGYLFVKSW